MRVFRFDEAVSIPVARSGSRFRIGPLTGDASRVRVQIMHLPPDGLVGRHPAASLQLFAVVAGEGWVSGDDGHRRPVGAGYAALWEPGEGHDAGTGAGLTAVCIEGDFEVRAFEVVGDEIVVSDYDPAWAGWFEQLAARIWPGVRRTAVRIDHVGSTSVPGLAAKPIVDIDIVVATEDDVGPTVEALAGVGYRWRGDLGVAGRQAFAAPEGSGAPRHNLYVVVEDSKAHLDHWLLRDLLRQDAEARERYAALKRRNAEAAGGDIDAYVAAKAAFVAELLTRARAERGLPPATYWDPAAG